MFDIYVILKAAITVDGFLGADKRLVISGPQDREAVLELRDSVDAILVGAGTLRADNPSLLAKSTKPLRVVLSKTAKFSTDLNLFNDDLAQTIVYHCNVELKDKTGYYYFNSETLNLQVVLKHLSTLGVKRLLVEGGADILNQFYQQDLFNELRLSIGAQYWGKQGTRLMLNNDKKLKLETQRLGSNFIHYYRNLNSRIEHLL